MDAPGGLCPSCLFSEQVANFPTTLIFEPSDAVGGPSAPAAFVSPSSLVNTDLGPYRLLEEIGRGGMGVVYRARHGRLDRQVAVKLILAGCAASPRQLELFLHEAQAAARVRHPHIVGVYEVGEIRGWHFMVMELVEGKSLAQAAREGNFDPDDAARIVRDVAAAMAYLHDQGIVHRDIKPSNILLDRDGIPYITDFGLAKVREQSSGLTTEGVLAGTPSYMSPEQASGGEESRNPQTDVFSLGAVLYELLVGRPPFLAQSVPETLIQVLKREPDPPRRILPRISADLESICMKCLEKRPAERYADMATLSADLDRYLDGEAVSARYASMAHRVRRWWRRDPALAARYSCLWLFLAIDQVWFHGLQKTTPGFYATTTVVGALWILSTFLFSVLLRRFNQKQEAIRSAWIVADIGILTWILLCSEGLHHSPLLMLYPIYIVAASLWNRVRAIWLATVLCILSDLVLWLRAPSIRAEWALPLPDHLIFAASLIVVAIVVAHQVRQLRLMRRTIRQHPSTER